ncbi:MAG: hypothetical protein AVDCRST_MAG95-1515 [uncultured Adhaeribacter sp.]|uniref:Uncharacterized protein n=1 Tax=uncultured Adhaeribacter sp. TaxID=448109 RepID=A0A6J4I885_9BACT|nr:MAG: hypothetical protein AVDCRST_MAG95-1515 [uncultured Adhaeribacter sp.]
MFHRKISKRSITKYTPLTNRNILRQQQIRSVNFHLLNISIKDMLVYLALPYSVFRYRK